MDKINSQVLFLHGALGVSEDLAELMNFIKDYGHETLSFNFSGHGATATDPTDFRIEQFAQDLDSFIKTNNLHRPVVFGYSMGGYVALYHKAHFESSPIKMIFTYGTKFNWSESSVMKEIPMLVPEHLEGKYPHVADTLKLKHGQRWRHILRLTAHMMQNLEKLDGLTKEDLSGVNIPIFLLRGDQDRLVSVEETVSTQKWLHHSEVKTISHSKHELERTNLKEVAEIMQRNLELL
jgi:pimeloyl-ACP methyl ester carboxylesterase